MVAIIDTNVAIHLRDGDPAIEERIAALPAHPLISVLTRVELEGGVYRRADEAADLRARLDLLLSQYKELAFTSAEAAVYGGIVEQLGYSRRRVIDRMIAATAIVHGASLLTANPADFRDIPGLTYEDWST
jgi:predicted nucleic acid-binding protein